MGSKEARGRAAGIIVTRYNHSELAPSARSGVPKLAKATSAALSQSQTRQVAEGELCTALATAAQAGVAKNES